MQRRGFALQSAQQVSRALHCKPLMIETQSKQSAKLCARAGPARTAVVALGHHNAMAGVSRSNGGINGEKAPLEGADFAHQPQQKNRIPAVDGGNPPATTPPPHAASFPFTP